MSAAVVLAACADGDTSPTLRPIALERSVGSLRLIGQQTIPCRTLFNGTTIGGLSGIEYDAASDRYVLISDGATFTNVTKTLVLDFETLKARLGNNIANLEGMTFGTRLTNGNSTRVVVADDNLPPADSVTDFNQFLGFEVRP